MTKIRIKPLTVNEKKKDCVGRINKVLSHVFLVFTGNVDRTNGVTHRIYINTFISKFNKFHGLCLSLY